MQKRARLFLFVLLAAFGAFIPASAQASVLVEQVSADYYFGEYVTLRGKVTTSQPITDVLVFLRSSGDANTLVERASLDADGFVHLRHAIQDGALRPFADVNFWFRFTLADGSTTDSPEFFFRYLDNRFPWQTNTEPNLRVHWYAGDATFGQDALDAARSAIERVGKLLPVTLNAPIDVFVYASSADLQTALEMGGQAWVAGHASPDLGVALVSIAPGSEQVLAIERQIPHELAHILTYRLAGERYSLLPVWLKEGIASVAELSPSPDYAVSLDLATQNGRLISFSTLCDSFPLDASSRFLAYAQSASFTRYIVDEYGISGLNRLVLAYADGLSCAQGVQQGLGLPLEQLERTWRANRLGENRLGLALQNLAGYFFVFAILLVLPIAPAFLVKKTPNEPSTPVK
jgi:hypothetical protein